HRPSSRGSSGVMARSSARSGSYPVSDSSGNTTREVPRRTAASTAAAWMERLASRSPALTGTWAAATPSGAIVATEPSGLVLLPAGQALVDDIDRPVQFLGRGDQGGDEADDVLVGS